ncbi:hypothetical protein ACFFWC_15820 [Plantactinospora siamensis]|uniref:Uncharacterized protein n=1 Tax=Plantactinospora siamensis TaxID=555372 RepID=A0ABV6NVQ3_9ACTN
MPEESSVPPSSGAPSGPAGSTGPAERTEAPRPTGRPGEASSPPPLSNPVPPTLRPATRPPDNPTDQVRTDVIGGWITRGGSGPCYGLVDDNGVEYALYGPTAGALAKGTRVVVRTAPTTAKVDCGPGRLLAIRSVRRQT